MPEAWKWDSRLVDLARPLAWMISLMTKNLGDRAERCAEDVAELAAQFGLSAEETDQAVVAALLHDLGMLLLEPQIVTKPGQLTTPERRQMQNHAALGALIVAELGRVEPAFEQIAATIRHHHERWDGQGYPDGLAGEEIPLVARMIAVVDAYSAMTGERWYAERQPDRVARLRIAQAVESQFDLNVVAAFERMLSARRLEAAGGLDDPAGA
jgi:HD-GYP domain-containing protein (c-di-GMP phosphodiesterase class II)